MLEHDRKVFEDVFRDPKVEENVETAHGEVVDEAQEVDADWDGRGKGGDKVCGIGRESKGCVDNFKGFQLGLTEV